MRRTFFLALEDQRKRDDNLFEELMYRNRFTKEYINGYEKCYAQYRRKSLDKKSRLSRTT